jgi:ribokinase
LTRVVVFGAINLDIILFIDRFPKLGEEVSVRELTRVPGGTGANVAVAASRLLKPGEVSLIGAVGEDLIGEEQLKILKSEGVDITGVKVVRRAESGQAYIAVDEKGENVIMSYPAANLRLTPEDVEEPQRLGLVREAQVIVIMDPPLPVAMKVVRLGRMGGTQVIWDPGFYSKLGLQKLVEVLSHVSYFILNRIEFEELLGTSDLTSIGRALRNFEELSIVVKMGEEGCALIKEGGERVMRIPSIPLEKLGMKAVSTVGCGDAFIGAFAASLAEGRDELEALKRANAAGAFKATRRETRGGPTSEELEEFLTRAATLSP